MTNKLISSLRKLPEHEQEEILGNGISFKIQDLGNKIDLAAQKIAKFESKYRQTLSHIEKKGLPNNTDVFFHEEYVEWKYWDSVLKESQKLLKHLRPFMK